MALVGNLLVAITAYKALRQGVELNRVLRHYEKSRPTWHRLAPCFSFGPLSLQALCLDISS